MIEQTAFTDEQLWESGMTFTCVQGSIECRYAPCTVVQEVRCCADCMMCHAPCSIARKKVTR